jgi:hypothetical protein
VIVLLGNLQNLNDPEILYILQSNVIEKIHFHISNPTINGSFIDAISNLQSVRQLTLYSLVVNETPTIELRKEVYMKLNKLSLHCFILISKYGTDYGNIFGEELFTMLKNQCVKCLHLECLNHYVERWLSLKHLHNRAEITNLCIVNDQFGYGPSEPENIVAPLYHTLTDYRLLFPKLKFLCIGICLAQFYDDRLDSMLLCYYQNSSFDIKLRLTIRLFHKLEEIPSERFEWIFNKLKSFHVEIMIIFETKKDARITIKSKNGNISSEIIVCFDQCDVETLEIKTKAVPIHKQEKCVDKAHYSGRSIHCLCINNC